MLAEKSVFTKLDLENNFVSFIALRAMPHAELLQRLEEMLGIRFIATDRADDYIHLIDTVTSFTFKDLECVIPDLWLKLFASDDDIVNYGRAAIEFDVDPRRNCATACAIHVTDGSVGYNSDFMEHYRQAINEGLAASMLNTVNTRIDESGVVFYNCDHKLLHNGAILMQFLIANEVRFDLSATDDLMVVKYEGMGFISLHDFADVQDIGFYERGTISIHGTTYQCETINVYDALVLVIYGYDNESVAYGVKATSIVAAQFAAYMMRSSLLVEPISTTKGKPQPMAYLTGRQQFK